MSGRAFGLGLSGWRKKRSAKQFMCKTPPVGLAPSGERRSIGTPSSSLVWRQSSDESVGSGFAPRSCRSIVAATLSVSRGAPTGLGAIRARGPTQVGRSLRQNTSMCVSSFAAFKKPRWQPCSAELGNRAGASPSQEGRRQPAPVKADTFQREPAWTHLQSNWDSPLEMIGPSIRR